MNPELQRNLWLEAGPKRLAWAATVLAVIYGAAFVISGAASPNPYAASSGLPQALFAQMIYDPLTQVGADGNVEPGLAVSWTQETPTTWVFRLRPGVTFSNGETFDATAVTDALAFLSTPQGQRDSIASQDIGKTVASCRAWPPTCISSPSSPPRPHRCRMCGYGGR